MELESAIRSSHRSYTPGLSQHWMPAQQTLPVLPSLAATAWPRSSRNHTSW